MLKSSHKGAKDTIDGNKSGSAVFPFVEQCNADLVGKANGSGYNREGGEFKCRPLSLWEVCAYTG